MPTIPFRDPVADARASLEKIWIEHGRRVYAQGELQKQQNVIREAERHKRKFYSYFPLVGPLRRELYPRHIAFFAAGAKYRERAAIMANRVGKTDLCSFELVCHLTGEYPRWWTGKRFKTAIRAWAAGDTNTTVRDIIQEKLLGRAIRKAGDSTDMTVGIGTGMIPGSRILSTRMRQGIPDSVEIIYVKHNSGGTSQLNLKSFEQGREAFQGTGIEVIWLDEECDLPIYTEALLRTMTTEGIVMLSFTPLNGLTEVVQQFLVGGRMPESGTALVDGRFVVTATWDNAPHLSDEAKQQLWKSIPPHQREARSKGVPQLGAGAIYPVAESDVVVKPFPIPDTWRKCYGLDVGWNRTAAIWMAEDPQSKVWSAYSEHYAGRQEPALQAQAIKARGEKIPGVIDPAARGRGQRDGLQLFQDYKDLGLNIETAYNSVEAGLYQVWQAYTSGTLKIFSNLQYTLEEMRIYRRDAKGHVVKDNDHLMDAKRYAWVSGRERAEASVSAPKDIPRQSQRGSGSWMSY